MLEAVSADTDHRVCSKPPNYHEALFIYSSILNNIVYLVLKLIDEKVSLIDNRIFCHQFKTVTGNGLSLSELQTNGCALQPTLCMSFQQTLREKSVVKETNSSSSADSCLNSRTTSSH